MIYSYRALDAAGTLVKGTLEAENRNLVVEALLSQHYTIVDLKEDKNKEAVKKGQINITLFEKVKIADLSLFTRQLSTMVSAGLPIVRSFEILEEQTKNDMRDLSLAVAEKVIQVSLRSSSAVISKMIQRATERLKRREWVHVYIAGCDSREIAQMTPQLAAALSPLSDHIRVVPVNEEERGTCIIEMPDTIIDASVSTQMENIRALVQEIPNEDQEAPMSFGRRISDIE
mgnify:CR=1 FL=1